MGLRILTPVRSLLTTEVKILPCRPTKLGKQEQFNSFNVTGLSVADISLENGDELNLIPPKFARPLYFFVIRLFGTSRNKYH